MKITKKNWIIRISQSFAYNKVMAQELGLKSSEKLLDATE